ncbi:hypothetical protein PCAR4_980032 [Paraburkholderia caribensis]|nr:hypothetical protein PCAR4_980032 [Paraburkholderia caribensis]
MPVKGRGKSQRSRAARQIGRTALLFSARASLETFGRFVFERVAKALSEGAAQLDRAAGIGCAGH